MAFRPELLHAGDTVTYGGDSVAGALERSRDASSQGGVVLYQQNLGPKRVAYGRVGRARVRTSLSPVRVVRVGEVRGVHEELQVGWLLLRPDMTGRARDAVRGSVVRWGPTSGGWYPSGRESLCPRTEPNADEEVIRQLRACLDDSCERGRLRGGDAVGFHRDVQWIHTRSPDRSTRGIELHHDLAHAPDSAHTSEATQSTLNASSTISPRAPYWEHRPGHSADGVLSDVKPSLARSRRPTSQERRST